MATDEGFHDFYRDAYPRLVAQLYAVTTALLWPRTSSRRHSCGPPAAGRRSRPTRRRRRGPQGGAAAAPGRRTPAPPPSGTLTRLAPAPAPSRPWTPRTKSWWRRCATCRRYREVLVLHHCLDRSVEDVGAHLGIPTATVKTRLARAGPCSPACSRRRPTNANKEHPMPGTDLGDRLDTCCCGRSRTA